MAGSPPAGSPPAGSPPAGPPPAAPPPATCSSPLSRASARIAIPPPGTAPGAGRLEARGHPPDDGGPLLDPAHRRGRRLLRRDLTELPGGRRPEPPGDEPDVLRLHLGDLGKHALPRAQVAVAEQRHHPVAGELVEHLVTALKRDEQTGAARGVVDRAEQRHRRPAIAGRLG